ncbi:MAG TPA: rod shape-determining protein MreD [bacterium]|nr:rod shape-determining protein MreD [bacterium]HNT66564.1 rod shape-determining protein MreD [bacterium]
MRHFLHTVILLVVVALQYTVVDLISIRGAIPNLVLVYLLIIAIRESRMVTTCYGFAVGLLQDFVSSGILGLQALAKTLCGFFAGSLFKSRRVLSSWRPTVALFGLDLLHNLLISAVAGFDPLRNDFLMAFASAFYTAAVGLIALSFLPESLWRHSTAFGEEPY